MQIITPLLGFLARSLSANSRAQPSDAILTVSPTVMPSIAVPFPLERCVSFAGQPPNLTLTGSLAVSHSLPVGATDNDLVVTLSGGVWRVQWVWSLSVATIGTVSDVISVGIGKSSAAFLANFVYAHPTNNSPRIMSGEMILTSESNDPLRIYHQIFAIGVPTGNSNLFLICSRLL